MKRLIAAVLLCVLLLTGCERNLPTAPVPEVPDGLTVHFIDVGQADSILLQCDGQAMLIDGGNAEDGTQVVSYLLQQGVTKLEYAVNTHPHEDHVGGLPAVLSVLETKNLWCPVAEYDSEYFEDLLYYAGLWELEPVCPAPGEIFPLGSAEITVLGALTDSTDINNHSLILSVRYGQNTFLFSGDAELEAERAVLDAGFDIACTVMKAGHHGSNSSNSYRWLREANPAYVVISVGADNSYGHPHDDTMSRFRDLGSTVYRTDLQGHIVCTSNGTEVAFTTEKTQRYIGSANSGKFHLPTCSGLPDEKHRVEFVSYSDAEQAGFSPCGNCIG